MTSPTAPGHSQPNPRSPRGNRSLAAWAAPVMCRNLAVPSGRALKKSTSAAIRVNPITQRYTILSFPKALPNKVRRIRATASGYRNISTGTE